MKVLIIEDNVSLARNLQTFLKIKDIDSEISYDWKDWVYKGSINYYDAIILDINLPLMNGFEVCAHLRKNEKNVPIIMLTSKWTNEDIVTGLDTGADDYLVKPFDYNILIARLHAITRRNLKNKSSIIKIKNFVIDIEKVTVHKEKEEIKLSSLEFNLLKFLAQNKWKVLNRQEIYEKVWWEFDAFMFSKNVDVYIWYLRKKLWKDIIETKKGVWYVIPE